MLAVHACEECGRAYVIVMGATVESDRGYVWNINPRCPGLTLSEIGYHTVTCPVCIHGDWWAQENGVPDVQGNL